MNTVNGHHLTLQIRLLPDHLPHGLGNITLYHQKNRFPGRLHPVHNLPNRCCGPLHFHISRVSLAGHRQNKVFLIILSQYPLNPPDNRFCLTGKAGFLQFFIQLDHRNIFQWKNNSFQEVFFTQNNILAIIDYNNSRTPKIYTTSSFKADEATTGYILNSSTLKDITFSAPKIPSLATMQLFIDCIEADYELDDVPDIFTDNIKSEELGLLWNLNKNNYNYSFQKAYCYDSTWDEFGNPTTLYWTLSFQKNNFTNDNSNPKELILYITVEYTDSNQFKISSILKK